MSWEVVKDGRKAKFTDRDLADTVMVVIDDSDPDDAGDCRAYALVKGHNCVKNAKLIAKSPEMKDCLEAIVGDCERFLDTDWDINPDDLVASFLSVALKYVR